uniref:Actin-interacting protein 1 n=1 Tax=Drosophila melanogaster TaxID=7227 RepID=WDR1_DROME|nr:flare, isoform A [Drosophila melanogaster]Q9VU68.1 RecName: Full=Actin-interacting protein 1; Short=AIP1; AltName: Full=Protein flare [Drosophila melanogaster]AAF49822.1 flare, isoform A [Drosophila melanogaster]AAL28888.1 LD27045p [Drosophila melanogaster]AOQ13996.1 flr-PA [synthetic construct]|eukprot:NP_648642.1 flare, isoform A [Drosophila melanogaster]
MAQPQPPAYENKNIYATLPRTQRGQPIVLGADPKGKNFLYTNGNSVIIRNIENPAIADVYTEHSCAVNVAKYSPSGFYIASGDASGKIRIWDTVNKEHLLKNEFQPIAGPIKDISWSPDNQRIVAVGEGRERFGHVFMSETGTSVGEISGQSKSINSADFRPARPFRIVTGSEDNTIAVFEGPPFKFKMTKQDHSRFVQAVRYSPDGKFFASAGFDGKVFLYDGTSSELVGEFGSPAHKGGVYALAWKPDSTQLLTCSGDKTCRLWTVESRELVSEFVMGTTVDDQQVSCLWQGDNLITVSLSGVITYLNVADPSKPLRVVKGHNKPITVLGLSDDRSTIYTGSHDGVVTNWNSGSGTNDRITGTGHGNQINGIAAWGDFVYTCGIDDSLRQFSVEGNSYTDYVVKLNCQPRGLAILRNENIIALACIKELTLVQDQKKIFSLPIKYEASSIAVNADTSDVAVGGDDQKLHIYTLKGGVLEPKVELDHLGAVTDVSYSPDLKYLVACDAHRKVVLYSVEEYKPAHNKEWGFHSARVNTVAWSPNSLLVASGSLDTTIIIWSVANPAKHTIIKNAHPQSQITRLVWLDNNTVISTGQDCNTKVWHVENI